MATLLLTPVCPHTCEHMWRDSLGRPGSALKAGFPAGKAPDFALQYAGAFCHTDDQVLGQRETSLLPHLPARGST